jgi:hypothetical protein
MTTMSKLDDLKKNMGTASKTMDSGASRFDAVEKTIFSGGAGQVSGSAEVRSSASEDMSPSEHPVPKPEPVKRTKVTVALTETDHKAWKVKLAQEGTDGQEVLESLVLEYLARP